MRPPRSITDEEKESLKELLLRVKTKADYQRVLCMWLRAKFGLNAQNVAEAVGWKVSTVRINQAMYFKEGEAALIGKGRGGRQHQNLSIEQEGQLLSDFLEKAKSGEILVVAEIKMAYEDLVGHRVPKSTIYRMLARHGWRKIAPRPKHPKADPTKQGYFKKTSEKL